MWVAAITITSSFDDYRKKFSSPTKKAQKKNVEKCSSVSEKEIIISCFGVSCVCKSTRKSAVVSNPDPPPKRKGGSEFETTLTLFRAQDQ